MGNYTPPDNNDIFKFSGTYTPPENNIIFTFSNDVADIFYIVSDNIEAFLSLNNSNIIEGWKISSDNINLSCNVSFFDADNNIVFDSHRITEIPIILSDNMSFICDLKPTSIDGGQIYNLPIQSSAFKSAWKQCDKTDNKNKALWNQANKQDVKTSIGFKEPVELSYQLASSWKGIKDAADISDRITFQDADKLEDATVIGFQNKMSYADNKDSIAWDKFNQNHHVETAIDYLQPLPKDSHKHILHDSFTTSDIQKTILYRQPLPNDKQHRTYWGEYWYSLLCKTRYYPPLDEIPFFSPKLAQLEEGLNKDVFKFTINNLHCPYDHIHSGERDPFHPPIIPPAIPDQIITPIQKAYYVMNSTFIRRISSNMENIDFQSVTIACDRDSWLWSFNIIILSLDSFNLIKPQNNNIFHSVEININGWKWTCKIENWREIITFGKRSWSVTGRSESIELGEPYSFIPAYSNEQMQGGQIVDDILENTNWAAEWKNFTFNPFVNWLVPAGCLNIANTSIIKIIQSVTDSINAFVQTNADTNTSIGATGVKKLYIKPTYKANAWNWGNITPSVVLNDSVCREIGRSNINYSVVNNVIVSGENQGVAVNATRQGTAGDKPASSITDPLITTREAGVERARHIISKSGAWVNHTLSLFSLLPPNSSLPLLLAGDFIQMNESGNLWVGQVIGNSIQSGWTKEGLKTTQTITVEQYTGE